MVYENHTGKRCAVILKNYFPYPVAHEVAWETYAGLDCPEFELLTGISFDHWWKIWIVLNKIVKDNIIFLWSEQEAYTTYEDKMLAAAERADDYTDTGLGCGMFSSITETCRSLLLLKYPDDAPSQEECNKFFDYVSCDQLPGDHRFVEQPYLFYRVGLKHVFWDYSRHSGMMRAVLRNLFAKHERVADNLRRKFASKFEEYIQRKIETTVPGVKLVKLNVKIKSNRRNHPFGKLILDLFIGTSCFY